MCLYVTSVKLSGSRAKVNSPALGSGVMGGRDVFPQEPRDPRRLLAGAREGQRGKTIPSVAPHKNTHQLVSFFSFFSISIFSLLPFVSLLLATRSLWFFLFLYLCTQTFNIISLTHVQSFTTTFMYSYTYTFLPILFLCWHERDAFQYASYMQSMGDIEIINSILCPNTCHTHRLLLEVFGKPIMTLQEERSEKVEGEKEKRQQKTRRKRKI